MITNTIKEAVGLTIHHFEQQGRPIKSIDLHPANWGKLRTEYLRDFPDEEMNVDHFNEIMVKDVTIRKGSVMMEKGMHIDFKLLTYDDEYKQQQQKILEQKIDEAV